MKHASATVSFRLPPSAIKVLKKHKSYTSWIKAVVIKNLGLCPACGQAVTKEKP